MSIAMLLTCGLLCASDAAQSGTGADRAKLAVLANRNNTERFARYYCRWRETRGGTKDLNSAFSGKVTGEFCECSLAFDSARSEAELYKCLAKPPAPKDGQVVGDRIIVDAAFINSVQMRHGDDFLSRHAVWPTDVSLYKREHWPQWVRNTPFSMGQLIGVNNVRAPLTLLRDHEQGKATLADRGDVRRNGRPLVQVDSTRGEERFEFYFDPQMGFLLTEMQWTKKLPDGKVIQAQGHVLEAKEIPGLGWFPMHVVGLFLEADGTYFGDFLQVQELRVGQDVKEEEFCIDLPAGTRIIRRNENGPVHDGSPFRLRQNETVKPEDLGRLSAMLDARKVNMQKPPEQRLLLDTAIPRAEGNRLVWGLALGGLGLALCGGVLAYWRRRWLAQRSQLQPGG